MNPIVTVVTDCLPRVKTGTSHFVGAYMDFAFLLPTIIGERRPLVICRLVRSCPALLRASPPLLLCLVGCCVAVLECTLPVRGSVPLSCQCAGTRADTLCAARRARLNRTCRYHSSPRSASTEGPAPSAWIVRSCSHFRLWHGSSRTSVNTALPIPEQGHDSHPAIEQRLRGQPLFVSCRTCTPP